jgi:membrane-associated phospholipid phosphatase
MQSSTIGEARDYNRGLAAPIRWAHIALATLARLTGNLLPWLYNPARRTWAPTLLLSLILVLALLPLDGPIARLFKTYSLGGDVRRELEALQQYGQGTCSAILAVILWLQSPAKRRELWNWAAAMALTWLAVFLLKTMVGRPRPLYDDPWTFLGPFGQYPIGPGKGVHHAWELWADISSRLWSMPSSHTAYACVASVFLASVYPRLRILLTILAIVVGLGRIITHAHYPTDVIAGAGIGLACTRYTLANRLGTRLADRLLGRPATTAPQAG